MKEYSACRIILLAVLFHSAIAWSQDEKASLKFEVASIKPYETGPRKMLVFRPNRLLVSGMSIKSLIKYTNNLQLEEQVIGAGPIGENLFVIEAKMDEGTAARLEKLPPDGRRDAQRRMLEALLVDRFKLKIHRESKDMRLYELVVAKGEPKMKEEDRNASFQDAGFFWDRGRMYAKAVPMTGFANVLSSELHQPVVDRTGLSGWYSFSLESVPDVIAQGDSGTTDLGPSIFTTVQQLGLKLNAAKGPVDVIVVEQVTKPSEN